MEKKKTSLPSGKDQTVRLTTVVREKWADYQRQEKRFSESFALALIKLHEYLARPGHGKFCDKLDELKIPTSTAYRLMKLHGWQQGGNTGKNKPERTGEDVAAEQLRDAERSANVYLKPFKKQPERLWVELTGFFQRVASQLDLNIVVLPAQEAKAGAA
jgi:hypothetical protein